MKKIFSASALATVIMMSGCEGGILPGTASPDISKPFELTAEIEQDSFKASADVMRSGADNWEFTFTEPQNIAGLVVSINDGIYSASLDGLSLETEDDNAVYSTIPSLISEAVDAASEADGTTVTDRNGIATITGSTGSYSYNIQYDRADGMIEQLQIPSQKLTVDFSEETADTAEAESQ